MNIGKCLIWPDSPATVKSAMDTVGEDLWIVTSPRAGGKYHVYDKVIDELRPARLHDADEDAKARLTTLLVDWRSQSGRTPAVTMQMVEGARNTPPLSVHIRSDRLLRFLARQSKAIGDTVDLHWDESSETDIDRCAMAWSESTTLRQVWFLLDYLRAQGWIERRAEMRHVVTVDGYRRIAEERTNPDARQAFVAMWFDEATDAAYRKGIMPAIESVGYECMRIDQKEDVVKIDDEIIAEIRRSRFLVADFTHGKGGARGGVYFEAGFALGLGIPVIYTCREDAIDEIHFDTRQYHHTTWKDPEDFRDKLEKRILALIGEGPEVSTGSRATSAAG